MGPSVTPATSLTLTSTPPSASAPHSAGNKQILEFRFRYKRYSCFFLQLQKKQERSSAKYITYKPNYQICTQTELCLEQLLSAHAHPSLSSSCQYSEVLDNVWGNTLRPKLNNNHHVLLFGSRHHRQKLCIYNIKNAKIYLRILTCASPLSILQSRLLCPT